MDLLLFLEKIVLALFYFFTTFVGGDRFLT